MSDFCGVIVALALIGLPISVIWLLIRIIRKKKLKPAIISVTSCLCAILIFTVIGVATWTSTDEYQEYIEEENKEKELAKKEEELKKREEALEIKEKENAKKEKTTVEPTEEPTVAPTVKPTEIPATETPKESVLTAFYEDLILNSSDYVGKSVETTIVVSNCTNLKDEYYILSTLNANYDDIKIYTESENNYESGQYVTVKGIINIEDGSEVAMNDTTIIATGAAAKENWGKQLQKYIEEFSNVAEKPTHDDLMRYPDSYSRKQIIINATITDVEPDGIIFNGKIQATMDGKEILLEDSREVREPRLQEGDVVTIYGFGSGLATVKEYDKSGIIPKVINEYNIPQISIRHIEF